MTPFPNPSSVFQWGTFAIFICAIIHTLCANYFTVWSEKVAELKGRGKKKLHIVFWTEVLHFLGEVEVIFGLWVIPLAIWVSSFYSWKSVLEYLDSRAYVEPMFVVVIMSLTATKPILQLAEKGMSILAKAMGGSVWAWWLSILTLGPILGSFITEAGAMTLCALLLSKHFYRYGPEKKLAYATLGLLFVNISLGGLLTNFSAPPILVIRSVWDWSSAFMFETFGIKAVIGIVIVNCVYFLLLRKPLYRMDKTRAVTNLGENSSHEQKVPIWITFIHIVFLVWIVFNSHHPPVFIGAFLLFLAFHQATTIHQFPVHLKRPLLVGLFLAGLFIHGGLQEWWIQKIIGDPETKPIMFISMVLTAFNDNAAVIYLASLLPKISPAVQYAVVSGVMVGGGLTVIANAPNPAGQVILKKFFKNKISPLYLLLAASLPAFIFYLIFWFFPQTA